MKAYKLTDQNGQTINKTQWGEGIEHTATGIDNNLCSDGWIHFYTSPLLAVLLNPIHANFKNPKLWECETSGEEIHEPLKSGCKTLKTLREIPLPTITTTQKVAFAILCAKKVCKSKDWNVWADNWLSNKDRSKDAASSAYASSAYVSAAYAAYASAASSAYASAAYASAAANAANAASNINFIQIAEEAMKY